MAISLVTSPKSKRYRAVTTPDSAPACGVRWVRGEGPHRFGFDPPQPFQTGLHRASGLVNALQPRGTLSRFGNRRQGLANAPRSETTEKLALPTGHNGVREYLVWLLAEARLEWFCLEDDDYRPQLPDAQGVLHSRGFPGLRLPVAPLLAGDTPKVLEALSAHQPLNRQPPETSVKRTDTGGGWRFSSFWTCAVRWHFRNTSSETPSPLRR